MVCRYLFFLLLFLFICTNTSFAQVHKVCIKSIQIFGHKKTKTSLIRHELNISEGDSLSLTDLMPTIEANKRFLINTVLFNYVDIKIIKWEEQDVHLLILLKESWYIFPLPVFELADRNFNVWWVQYERDLRRANLGGLFLWRNMTGYNDILKVVAQFGYTRKFELDYILPPMGRKRKFGFAINALYSDNKEIAYNTFQNKLLFYSDYNAETYQLQRIRAKITGYYRRTLWETQRLELSFLQMTISDTVKNFNPDFFLDGRNIQRSFNLKYTYTLDKRDIQAYPLHGYYIKASLEKEGLGIFNDINQLKLNAHFGCYIPIGKRLTISTEIKGQFNFIRNKIPYNNNIALGYNDDFVRGYQYYVVNGQDYLLFKTDINFKILDFKIPLFKKTKVSYFQSLPIKIHLRYHLDFGHAWDRFYAQSNGLSNSDLMGTGLGVDFVFYAYNIILQFEYSFNKNGENGLYLRYALNF